MTRSIVVGTLALTLAGAACGSGGPKEAHVANRTNDAYGEMAVAAGKEPCSAVAIGAAGPVPTSPGPNRADVDYDVVLYLAHPEDETLFAPGTLGALVKAKRKVFTVVMSHGEGGRLLERDADGQMTERTGVPPEKVAEVRDHEFARVMKTLGIEFEHLYPASAKADFAAQDVQGHDRAIHACGETLEHWDDTLPDGVAGILRKLVASIRTRRPRVIVTHDPRDDDDWLDHGHHKALGALVDMAARAAADPRIPGGDPFVVEELDTIAPKQAKADVTLDFGNDMRKRLMAEHASQFEPQKFAEIAQRTVERFVVAWRAKGAEPVPGGSRLAWLTQSAK